MATNFTLRKKAGGSALRGGDQLRAGDPAPRRPENLMTGQWFIANGPQTSALTVDAAHAKQPIWRNTAAAALVGVQTLALLASTLGYELDYVNFDSNTPANIVLLNKQTLTITGLAARPDGYPYDQTGTFNFGMSLYQAGSGGLVFAAGTWRWPWGLSPQHGSQTAQATDLNIQQATLNLLKDLGVSPGMLMDRTTNGLSATELIEPDPAAPASQYGLIGAVERLPLTDSMSVQMAAQPRTLPDSIPMSDTLAGRVTIMSRTVTDTMSMSDIFSRISRVGVSSSDSLISLSDAMTKTALLPRTLTDAMSLSELLTRSGLGVARTMSDSMVLSETLTRLVQYLRSMADSIPMLDVLARAQAYQRTMSETIPLSDSLASRWVAQNRTLVDTMTMSDLLTRLTRWVRSMPDTAPALDVFSRVELVTRSMTDSIPLVETMAPLVGPQPRSLTDSLPTLTDAMTRKTSWVRSMPDSAPATDVFTVLKGALRTMGESMSLTDSMSRQRTVARTLSDAIPLVEALNYFGQRIISVRTMSDSVPLADFWSITAIGPVFPPGSLAALVVVPIRGTAPYPDSGWIGYGATTDPVPPIRLIGRT